MTNKPDAEQDLQNFVSIVAHDFRGPVRHVREFSKLLVNNLGDTLDGDNKSYIEFMQQGADRLGHMIDDLTAFSRVQTHQKPYEAIHTSQMIDDVLAALTPLTDGKDITITKVDDIPDIEGDPDQLQLVFYNILKNALLYHAKDTKIEVDISAKIQDGQILFQIQDNGIGMDEKSLECIFNMFQRLHAHEAYGGGTGAGLAIVQRIIQRHGGQINVTSVPDEGTNVSFCFGKHPAALSA